MAARGPVHVGVGQRVAEANGWTIAEHAGDRSPDRTQRLLNRAVWDAVAAMSEVRRFAVRAWTGRPAGPPPGGR